MATAMGDSSTAAPAMTKARSVKSMSSALSTSGATDSSVGPSKLTLARRLLFPHLPPSQPLPPLLLTADPVLDAELYDFIALSLRAFVNPWWSKISRYDRNFIVHINIVVTHVIRSLESRLLAADLSPLIFAHLPTLVAQHYRDYRLVTSKLDSSYAAAGGLPLPRLFHNAQSHLAVSPDGKIDEDYLRHVVDHILLVCLPPEDYAPETERFVIREIILKVLLGSIIPRITQPWFIHKLILEQLDSPSKSESFPAQTTADAPQDNAFTLQSFIVTVLSAVQSLSALGLFLIAAYKSVMHTIKHVNTYARSSPQDRPPQLSVPDCSFSCLDVAAELLCLRDRYCSCVVLMIVQVTLSLFHTFVNRLYPYLLYTRILTSQQCINVLKAGKNALFPNGYPAPPPIDPSPEEQAVMLEQLICRLHARVPPLIALVLFGPNKAAQVETIEAALEPLSSAECNSHLVLFILDNIILTAFPELGPETRGADTPNSAMDRASSIHSVATSVADISLSESRSP